MTVQEAISARHSVRTYLTKPVEPAIVNALRAEIAELVKSADIFKYRHMI